MSWVERHTMQSAQTSVQKSGIVTRCPITGLSVYTRPEWKDVSIGPNYYLSVRIIGDGIMVAKIVGDSNLENVIAATKFMDKVIRDMFGMDRRFVYVEDFTELKSITNDSKKYYLRYLESKTQMMALIICTQSPLIMMMIKLGSRLNIIKCNAMVVKDLDNAIKRALEFSLTDNYIGPQVKSIPRLSSDSSCCLISGLPLTEKNEWTRMDLGGPSVSFKLIGTRILFTEFHDWENTKPRHWKMFLEKRRRVLSSMFHAKERFVDIRDFSGMKIPVFSFSLMKVMCIAPEDGDRVLCYIGFHMSLRTRWAFRIEKIGSRKGAPWHIGRGYKEALDTAIYTLKSYGYTHEGSWNTVKKDTWQKQYLDFAVFFEVIDDNVVHRKSKGLIKEEYIDDVFKLQEIVLAEAGLDQKLHYVLIGLGELEGASLKLRKIYFKRWSAFLSSYPNCQMNFMYGGNRVTRASLSISNYLRPYKIYFTDTREEAMQLIGQDKERQCQGRKIKPVKSTEQEDGIRQYADELIYFLGNINWELDGVKVIPEEKSPDHPFKVVFDAIALIKMDIDELFREREQTQIALLEGEEVSRALLNASNDSSILVQTDGTILSVNETFARRFGRTPQSLKYENIKDLVDSPSIEQRMHRMKKVVDMGEPVRFEDEENGRCFDNTIYPVFSAEGGVDRIAMYSRDITDLKNTEKHIQALTQEILKAQENERQRIARDLHDNVAQDLASLIINSDTLFEGYPNVPNEVKRRNMAFSQVLKRAIASIRDLAYDLRPPSLDQLGLVRTLSQYCTDFSETNMVIVDFYSAGLDKLKLDFDTEINVYRLIQEALNNVRKHSGANIITIRLVASFPEIILRIEDDGRGFDLEKRVIEALNEKRMGLKSMEERVKLLNGTFSIRSRPGEGTMILAKLPYCHDENLWDEDFQDKDTAS